MNRSSFLFSAILGLAMLSSCSPRLSPFTQNLYEENNWTEDQLRQIQFYLSDNIVLYRELNEGGKSEIIEGEIKVVNGKKRDQITFKSGTPGVFMFSPKTNRFAVSFEDSGDERFLIFGPSPKAANRFVLMASDWNRRRGVVSYAGQKWNVDASSAFSSLLVDLKRLHSEDVNTRVASGRRVGG